MAKELAPEIKVPLLTRLLSIVYLLWVHFVSENIFVWSWIQGKRNIQADIVGPAYVLGAPNRQLEEGKAILATTAELKASIPCIVDIQVLDSDRKPIPHLSVDWWQTDTKGVYSFSKYNLRGKMMTDDNGRLEILTVPPHDYGVSIIRRIAHYHLTLQPTSSRFYALTSQLYFCARNDPRVIDADMVNFSRRKNLLKAWCIPENNGGKPFLDLPPLAAEDAEMGKKVAWWNKKLAELGDFKVAVGGHTEFVLTSK